MREYPQAMSGSDGRTQNFNKFTIKILHFKAQTQSSQTSAYPAL